jgi:hypothetical protein
MADEPVTPENVSLELLRALFDAAMYDVAAEGENELRVRSGYTLWVTLSQSKRNIRFTGVFGFRETAEPAARLALANDINDTLVLVRAAVSGDQRTRLWLDQYVWLEGGVSRKNIVLSFRQFAALVEAALKRDTTGLIS